MESERIDKLLEKYWICETTLSEEEEIRQFFTQSVIPENLRKYKPFFIETDVEDEVKLNEEFDKRILTMIESDKKPEKRKMNSFLKIAASIAILFTLFFSVEFYIQSTDPWRQDTFENPEEALEHIQKVLSEVNGQINRGQDLLTGKMEEAEPMLKLFK